MQLQIYKFQSPEERQFSEVRTIETDDGKILFCASDVAKMLGYSNPHDAISKHCRYLAKHEVPHPQNKDKSISVSFIPEGDVYRLIVRSKLPSAEAFEKWLFDEVVPSIRNKGFYGKIDRTALPNFIERYKDNYHKIPGDHFSVISEMFARLYMSLEKVGYVIPDKGVSGAKLVPDISVGRGFAGYLKGKGSSHYGSHKTYKHSFPDGRIVDANMYHIDALPDFIKYINEKWIPENAEKYFKTRDPLALDYLPKLLGAGK